MVDSVVDVWYWPIHPLIPFPPSEPSVLQKVEIWKPHFAVSFTAWVLGLKYLPQNVCIHGRSKGQKWSQHHLPCPMDCFMLECRSCRLKDVLQQCTGIQSPASWVSRGWISWIQLLFPGPFLNSSIPVVVSQVVANWWMGSIRFGEPFI